MAKRVRTLETLGSLPYTTIDGGKWLKKALDPADIDVEINGVPDTTTNPCCVLNYQFQGDIPIPHSNTYIPSTTQSYDVDFYVYQNPVTLGMSVSRPAGTHNPVGTTITVNKQNRTFTFAPGTSLATVQVFENPQIEGDTKNEKLNSLERYCQRYRMAYGGVQCIPACSALFDSGTIEATQQVFSPEVKHVNDNLVVKDVGNNTRKSISDGKVYLCQRFEKNDFPDEGSSIQNATALYCRYKEGLYMPYKIKNPLVYPYKGSEQRVYTEAPYVITDQIYFRYYYVTNNPDLANDPTHPLLEFHGVLAGVINPENNSVQCPEIPSGSEYVSRSIEDVFFKCYTKTGIPFIISMRWDDIPNQFILPDILPVYNSNNVFGLLANGDSTSSTSWYHIEGGEYGEAQMGRGKNDASLILNKNFTVNDIPTVDSNIGIVCFRSIGLQASIRVIFRFGLEMMITAGGVYTPFKHKAPKYDQKALNSYVRAVHNMRDAFLGNAATPEGHALFAAHIAAIASAEESNYISNQGSKWYGAVSV